MSWDNEAGKELLKLPSNASVKMASLFGWYVSMKCNRVYIHVCIVRVHVCADVYAYVQCRD